MLKNTPTNNKHILLWIEEMADMCRPDNIVWIDGGDEQTEFLRAQACASGEIIKLNQEKLPGCYLHRTAINDVARVEGRTFICTKTKEDAGNINNWMHPDECKEKLSKLYAGSGWRRPLVILALRKPNFEPISYLSPSNSSAYTPPSLAIFAIASVS